MIARQECSNILQNTCFILNHPEWRYALSSRQPTAPFTQVIVVDHLAVETLADYGALATIIAGNTHVHLLSLFILLNVWVL